MVAAGAEEWLSGELESTERKEAPDGPKALEILRKSWHSLVALLDLRMLKMEGEDALMLPMLFEASKLLAALGTRRIGFPSQVEQSCSRPVLYIISALCTRVGRASGDSPRRGDARE